ncbi:MAG: vWA domain-containing protein, partial [Pyrobaculum sp.]
MVAPKIHVFLHNSTLCVDLSDFDMPRGVVDVPGLSWRGGLTWCGRAELPGYIRVRIGELERRYYVAKPEVRLYSLSPGLSPLASVSGSLCGVSLDTLDAPGITPYPHTSVLYTDGVIYAHVYPGPVVRQIKLVLRELCAPVFYHLEATANVTGRQIRAVVLVIDVSGSMAGEKLETAKRVASTVVDILAGGKVPIGLIAFSDRPRVVSPLTTDYTKLKRDLGALSAGGSTNIGDSLTAAFELLGGTGAVVLLTDGQHNVGTPPAQALSKIKITAPVYAIGLGKDVNETELRYIARQTGGVYLFSPTAKELEQAFSQWLWSWETLVFNGTGSASISGSLGLYRIHAQDPDNVELIFQTSPTFADRCAAIPLTLVDQCGLGHYDPSTKTATINTYGASFTISAKTPATVSSPMPTAQFIVGSDAACVGDHYTFKVVGLSEVAAYIDGRRVPVEEVGGWRRVKIDSGAVLRIEAKILDPVTKAVVKTELKTVDIRKCAEIKVQPPELWGKAPSNFQMTVTVTGAVSPGQLEIFIVPPLEIELDRIRIRPANPNEPYEITGRVLRAVDDYIVVNLLQGGNKLADKLVKVSFETTGSVRPASDSKVIIQPVGTHSDTLDTVATGTPQLKLLYTPEWAKATVEGSTIKLSTELKTPGLYSDSVAFTDMYNIWWIRLVAVAVGNEVDLSTVKWALADKWELSLPYLTLTARRPGYIVTGLVTKFQGLVKPPYIYAVYTNATFEAEPAPGWRLLYYYQGKWTTRRPPSISFQQHTPYIAVAPDVKYDVNFDGKIDLGDIYTIWLRIKGQQVNVSDDILDINGD